jgi:hypothetical protein
VTDREAALQSLEAMVYFFLLIANADRIDEVAQAYRELVDEGAGTE